MVEHINISGVEIEVTFKDIKNLHLSVHPPLGKVTIASPERYDLERIRIYAATKLSWIKKEQAKFLGQARESERDYINQESHYFLGNRYLLKVELSGKNQVIVQGKKMVIRTSEPQNKTLLVATLYKFYRKELKKCIQRFMEHYASVMKVELPHFKIRSMRTKWGSCNPQEERLWFNIELAKKPFECIEYVVVHELVHLLERHHNKRFIMLMDQYLPTWRVQKKLLNELPISW